MKLSNKTFIILFFSFLLVFGSCATTTVKRGKGKKTIMKKQHSKAKKARKTYNHSN